MNIQNVVSPFAQSASSTAGSTNDNSTTMPSNQLNANSFITLLTAQLKAQDPLSPMSPDQMMGELVSLNSLQQLIAIKQDLDNLGGATGSGAPAPGGKTGATQPAQG